MADGLRRYFLVLSQAKTGTTTLAETLSSVLSPGAYLGRFHDHRLRPVDPAVVTPKKLAVHRRNLEILERIRSLDPEAGRLVVVTAVRDPVARIYSHFFEKWVYPSGILRGSVEDDWTDGRFVDAFRSDFRSKLGPLLRGELGFLSDVVNDGLALEFPNLGFRGIAGRLQRADRYVWYASGAIVGLVLPHEGLVGALRRALVDHGHDTAEIPETVAYASGSRGFARLYRAFMDNVPFPDRMLDLAYRSPMPRLLYSPREIAAMRQRWVDRWRPCGDSGRPG